MPCRRCAPTPHLIVESARLGLRELDRLVDCSRAGQGRDRRHRPPLAIAGCAGRAAARAGADAEGAGDTAQDRAADRDGVAADVAGRGGGEGGERNAGRGDGGLTTAEREELAL
jgi:hypothetical protein